MRFILGFLALASMSQPALACAMDGMFGGGAHRFNPFLAMQTGSGDQTYDQDTDLSDTQDDYADSTDDSVNEDAEQETTEYNPRDL